MFANQLMAGKKYTHPDGLYSYHLKPKSVTIRFRDRQTFEAYKCSRQFKQLQDLVDITTNGGYVHVHSQQFAIAAIDAVPRRGHLVWLRAFNRSHLAAPVERAVRKSRTIAVKYDQAGAVASVVETTTRKVKLPPRRKHVAPVTQPVDQLKLNMLVDRFRRSA